jgi:hypothetical protein
MMVSLCFALIDRAMSYVRGLYNQTESKGAEVPGQLLNPV